MNNISTNKIFNSSKIPIWLMRQAGRYLPEYRNIRSTISNFLELCYNTQLLTEVTLQPIRRFDFDAAIIFSDILVIPDALGIKVSFEKNHGPKLVKISSAKDLSRITEEKFFNHLSPIYQGIELTRSKLSKDKKLIGFIGAPWTLACYMIEGGGSKYFNEIKDLAYNNSKDFEEIVEILIEYCAMHLIKQIESGADIVQIFDSWAGIIDEENFEKWVIEPTKQIVKKVKAHYPHVPIIGFPRGAGFFYNEYIRQTKIDIISLDNNLPKKWIKSNIPKIITQGNLDPIYLLSKDKDILISEIKKVLECFKEFQHIFNLGHGILPNTPIENVELLIKTVREYEKNSNCPI